MEAPQCFGIGQRGLRLHSWSFSYWLSGLSGGLTRCHWGLGLRDLATFWGWCLGLWQGLWLGLMLGLMLGLRNLLRLGFGDWFQGNLGLTLYLFLLCWWGSFLFRPGLI